MADFPVWLALHSFVVGAAATLWRDPVDDLGGVGDIAGFAVDAVCGADLQFWPVFIGHHFVYRGGTKILAGVSVFADAAVAANIRLENDEVAGLIFVVARSGMIDVGEAVESELAVAAKASGLIDQGAVAIQLFVFLVARFAVHGIDQAAAAGDELNSGFCQAGP